MGLLCMAFPLIVDVLVAAAAAAVSAEGDAGDKSVVVATVTHVDAEADGKVAFEYLDFDNLPGERGH